jgi:hypothetical protein
MEHIKLILDNYLKKHKIGKYKIKDKTDQIFENWNEVIDGRFLKYTEPYKIVNNKLFIYVKNSVIISELMYQKKQIIETINKKFLLSIKDIQFKIKQ